MSSRKSKRKKDFLIAIRKRHSDRLAPAPVWTIQRKGSRIFNPKQQRNWRETHLMLEYKQQKKQTAGHKSKKKQKRKAPPQIKK